MTNIKKGDVVLIKTPEYRHNKKFTCNKEYEVLYVDKFDSIFIVNDSGEMVSVGEKFIHKVDIKEHYEVRKSPYDRFKREPFFIVKVSGDGSEKPLTHNTFRIVGIMRFETVDDAKKHISKIIEEQISFTQSNSIDGDVVFKYYLDSNSDIVSVHKDQESVVEDDGEEVVLTNDYMAIKKAVVTDDKFPEIIGIKLKQVFHGRTKEQLEKEPLIRVSYTLNSSYEGRIDSTKYVDRTLCILDGTKANSIVVDEIMENILNDDSINNLIRCHNKECGGCTTRHLCDYYSFDLYENEYNDYD